MPYAKLPYLNELVFLNNKMPYVQNQYSIQIPFIWKGIWDSRIRIQKKLGSILFIYTRAKFSTGADSEVFHWNHEIIQILYEREVFSAFTFLFPNKHNHSNLDFSKCNCLLPSQKNSLWKFLLLEGNLKKV